VGATGLWRGTHTDAPGRGHALCGVVSEVSFVIVLLTASSRSVLDVFSSLCVAGAGFGWRAGSWLLC